jgi:hypothetical protein
MQVKNYSLVALCATILLANCSKDGKNGVDGVNGKTTLSRTTQIGAGSNCASGGTKFETGIDANNNGTLEDAEVTTTQTQYVCNGAGAIYSNWIDVNVVDNLSPLSGEEYYYYRQNLPATPLTADVVNKGIVLMYYKNKAGIIVSVERDSHYPIMDVDAAGSTIYVTAGFTFKQNYLTFLVDGVSKASVNDNGSAVRYVVVPGIVTGRVEDLKKLPYSEVAKLYNLQD